MRRSFAAGFVARPFEELKRPEHGAPFFAADSASGAVEYRSGGYFGSTPMIAKWMDFGGLKGGLSLFQRRCSFEPDNDDDNVQETVRLQLSELDQTLRLMCVHKVNLTQGQSWASEEYLLTPHRNGWAAGIVPYRKWVSDHLKREFPVPDHVRRGLGYRTIFMSQNYPNVPGGDHNFRFADLPMLARESKEHGIDELCLWDWNLGLQVPIPPTLSTARHRAGAGRSGGRMQAARREREPVHLGHGPGQPQCQALRPDAP